jgi:type VI secretion system protein ImpH
VTDAPAPPPISRPSRAANSALARLLREPRRFAFDAGVRVLMQAAGTPDPAEAVRFRSLPGLGFAGADISRVQESEAGGPPRLTTPVMALTGPAGVLPRYYTEVLSQTLRDRSRAMHDFVDLLSHRMVGHFARAGVKYRLARAVETARLAPPAARRPDAPPADPVAMILLSLTGYGTGHQRNRLAAGTDPLLHYAGMLGMRPRSADRLAALASDWLGRPVEVVQFAGAWLPLPPDQRSAMPVGRRAGQFNRLGVDAAIGTRAWDAQARVVLRVGPLDRAAFTALLPDQPALRRFVSLIRAFLGFETAFAVNLVLAAEAVPDTQMGGTSGARLGWNTWMPQPGRRRTRDATEALFEAELVEAGAQTGGRE